MKIHLLLANAFVSLSCSLPNYLSEGTSRTAENGDLVIALEPMIDIPEEADGNFPGFYFEPYMPDPSVSWSCYDACFCSWLPWAEANSCPATYFNCCACDDSRQLGPKIPCECGIDKTCRGSFDADLTKGDTITFQWDASRDGSKYMTINGGRTTRIEFLGTLKVCNGWEQIIRGLDISYEFDFVTREGITQSYEYDFEYSLVILGGCKIYARLQFDPSGDDEQLMLSFKRLSVSAEYNSDRVSTGVRRYNWPTSHFNWIRDSTDQRRLLSSERNLDEGTNSYMLHDLPHTPTVSPTNELTTVPLIVAMLPMIDIPEEADGNFPGLYFEPYMPDPSVSRSCYNSCPCSYQPTDAESVASCDCGVEMVCGGAFNLDLTTGDTVTFRWDASSNEAKYMTIDGNGRTRIEFQAKLDDGDSDSTLEQQIYGSNISYEFDFVDREGIPQAFEYNSASSFVILGNCEIYARLQFDPSGRGGLLGLSFKRLSFSADYDSESVVTGLNRYLWATSGYSWIRDAQNFRRLPSNEQFLEEGTNSYQLLDLPNDTTNNTEAGKDDASGSMDQTSPGAVSSTFCLLVVALASLLAV